ncbi:putative disulphide-isomerase [Flavobacteriaceae bacterium 3519-10]|nr:putative disulphide-isomerase [Flavobacteriaceae bacterium 3519-10]
MQKFQVFMKKILLLILFSISTPFLAQQSINFETGTFQEILAKAKSQKKLVFMDAFAVWCGPCKMMEKNIFPLPAVREYYNANFINARIDMEKGEGIGIAQRYGIRSYPSYLILNGDGEVVKQTYGYMGEEPFLAFAKQANDPKFATSSNKELFEKGESAPEFLLNMMQLYSQTDFDVAQKASERYFQVKKDQALTKDEVGLLLYFTKSPVDVNYKTFVSRKPEIITLMSEDIYNQFDTNIKISSILENAMDKKTGRINDGQYYKDAIPLVGAAEAEIALHRTKVIVYPNAGLFDEYEKAALSYYKNSENFSQDELLKAAWIFSDHVTNISSLKKAQEWAEKSVMQAETPENTYILARLYAKTGQKENAKMYAESSKNLAERLGKDATAAIQLLGTLK